MAGILSAGQSVMAVAKASIIPFKVTTVNLNDYKGLPIQEDDGHMILYLRSGLMECVFSNKVDKSFRIFRLTNNTNARTHFQQYSSIIKPLTLASSSIYDEGRLQKISDTIKEYPDWKPVHIAAYVGLYECFHHKDIKGDIDNQVANTLFSPLMTAVQGKNTKCVTALLDLGARLDLQNHYGDTVYHHAVLHYPKVIPKLAKYDHPNSAGRVVNYPNHIGWTALYCACQNGKSDIVKLLLDAGANPNVTDQEMFPIPYALKNEDNKSVEGFHDQPSKTESIEMVEKLCREKADMNVKSNTGHTPLHIMQEKGRADCLMELLCWGADPSIGDNDGNTPLHIAVIKDNVEMVKIFVAYGADVNVKNKKNQSPRHLASTSNGKDKELILYMLHVSGALRCDDQMKNCLEGCYVNGNKDGKPDDHINQLLERDQSEGLLDEMCGSTTDSGYRLLSLDGGGIRGIVLCLMLIAIEKEVGKPIKECFDWIAGTSTGGLLALGICTGKPLSYIRGLYLRLKDEVFVGSRPYQTDNFEAMLKQEFGEDKVMTDLKNPRAIVTGVLADRHPSKLHLFRTYEPTLQQLKVKRQGSTKKNNLFCPAPPNKQKVWEAARCSCAAPTFFKAFGPYIDGGLEANNPTLDLMTEIHEYNCGLNLRNQQHLVRPIGLMVSLGTGQVPIRAMDTVDVYKPKGIFDVTKIANGFQNLINLMVDKATIAEGRPVDRSRAWCGMLGVPFYRFSPPISKVEMDELDNQKLTQLMWETQCYIVANKDRIKRLASYLRRDS